MDFIKSQFDRIQQQLAGLTASQKMLSGALVAIMVMTMLWWGKYAGTAEMVPLLDQTLTADEQTHIAAQLAAAGIDYKPSGDGKLLVPADKQMQALANLSLSDSLPKVITNGFDEMIKQLSPWDGQGRENAIFNHGRELLIERVIGAYPGVKSASVIIDHKFQRIIGQNVEPTATVSVTLRDPSARGTKQLATACANFVCGADAGLTMGRIRININGAVMSIRDPAAAAGAEGLPGDTLLELQRAAELHYTDMLKDQLEYIAGVKVSVNVRVTNSSKHSENVTPDKSKSFVLEQEQLSQATEQVSQPAVANEGGAVPNLANAGPVGGGPQHSGTETRETIKNMVAIATLKEIIKTPAGDAAPIGAAIRIPRSFFVQAAKLRDSSKEPDAAAIDRVTAAEIEGIRRSVKSCTAIATVDGITVEPYTDLVPLVAQVPQAAAASSVSLLLGGHVKEIALSGLAMASLFMMSMIVRRGAPAGAAVSAPFVAASPRMAAAAASLGSGEAFAGEVSEGRPALDGMELDDESIKTQQMLNQVTDLIGDSPDAAATLIKRWINQR
jgi:flagellar biosynthesis/type III secretory pathway M-ring protein FliF/YscJ